MSEIVITERTIAKPEKPKPFDWHDHAVSHNVLSKEKIIPMNYLVDGMIVEEGTGVLAGPKKKGKSFMGTQLSQAAGSGGSFLGRNVKQCRVVHFALEDGKRRTQNRIHKQMAPDNLPITYFYEWPAWNTELGFRQLEDMIKELKPGLIVVDTFAKCLNGKPDQNSAGDMGDFGNRIHDLALKYNVFILFIAHHGKMATRDPGFDIRGSSAIPGATDVNIGLYKNEDGTFDLIGEGRDIEEFDLRITLDKELTWAWQYQGEAQDARRTEAEQKIIDAIIFLGGDAEASVIAEQANIDRSTAQYHLKRMREGDNPSISYKILNLGRIKKITYSLTSSTSSTVKTYTHHQQMSNGVNDVDDMGTEAK